MGKTKQIKTLSDLTPDTRNANKGTQRGGGLLESSLQNYGAGRSVLVDRNGNLIAGNKTTEAAVSVGLDDDVILVPSDGKKLVVVQRIDLDINDKAARELAINDNRIAEINLDWDVDVLASLADEGVEFGDLWSGEEMAELLDDTPDIDAVIEYDTDLAGKNIYEPTNKDIAPSELFEEPKAELLKLVKSVKDDTVRKMLEHRYSFFVDYKMAKIADYYCNNASKEERAAFEALGLVILDKDAAIERGFVEYVEEVESVPDEVD